MYTPYDKGLFVHLFAIIVAERKIDGATLCLMSREDIAILYPGCEQFILGMKLYKFIQEQRGVVSDSSFGNGSINSGSTSEDFAAPNSRKRSTHNEDLGSSQKRSVHDDTLSCSSAGSNPCSSTLSNKSSEFKLPFFSRDVEKAIEKDQFYTSAKRSKLIREACRALKGHCRSGNRTVSSRD